MERLTPREELQREKRHSRLTQYLKDNNISLKSFLVWYNEQTGKQYPLEVAETQELETSRNDSDDFIVKNANSMDYAANNFQPMKKWPRIKKRS